MSCCEARIKKLLSGFKYALPSFFGEGTPGGDAKRRFLTSSCARSGQTGVGGWGGWGQIGKTKPIEPGRGVDRSVFRIAGDGVDEGRGDAKRGFLTRLCAWPVQIGWVDRAVGGKLRKTKPILVVRRESPVVEAKSNPNCAELCSLCGDFESGRRMSGRDFETNPISDRVVRVSQRRLVVDSGLSRRRRRVNIIKIASALSEFRLGARGVV
jgi:hypothetical protein